MCSYRKMLKLSALKRPKILIIGLGALCFWMIAVAHLRISWSDSLKERVFWLVSPQKIVRGDVIDFVIKDKFTKNLPHEMIKRVGCDSGDFLSVDNRRYYCNQKFIGQAKTHSQVGEPVGHYAVSGKIPEGYVFAIGDSDDSYDSRYYGLVKKSDIYAKVVVIF